MEKEGAQEEGSSHPKVDDENMTTKQEPPGSPAHCETIQEELPTALSTPKNSDSPVCPPKEPPDNKSPVSSKMPKQHIPPQKVQTSSPQGSPELENSPPKRKRKRPAIWQCVKKNIYTHRRRKTQRGDDVMICQCVPHQGKGCGADCINRVLNLECVQGYCPCGDACRNQMFTKRQYAKLSVTKAGAKGYGLCAAEPIKAGQYLIEYIGEVLEEEEYNRRKDYYAGTGQRHYYFMNIGNGEVIDACRKGNLGRFINHSCEPNCETQKWVVEGELAIGLFALRDIAVGTELTFDYNFERYGDRPMRCYCETPSCRGYIGGTPGENVFANGDSENNTNDSSDEEDVPIMLEEHIDPVLTSILNKEVGIKDELGFDGQAMRQRLESLFIDHEVDVQPPINGESDERWVERALNCSWDEGNDVRGTIAHGNKLTCIQSYGHRKRSARRGIYRGHGSPSEQYNATSHGRLDETRGSKSLVREALVGLAKKTRAKGRGKLPGSPVEADKQRKSTASASGGSSEGPSPETGRSRQFRRVQSIGRAGPQVQKRSSLERSLDLLASRNGQMIDPTSENVIKVLRLFNLCEMGPKSSKEIEAARSRSSLRSKRSPARNKDGAIGQNLDSNSHGDGEGYYIPKDDNEIQLSARQRATLAGLSLLLDVVIKTQFSRRLFVKNGALFQLQQAIGRNFGKEYSVMIRKILKAVDSLPFVPEDFSNTKSNHGAFLCLLQVMHRDHPDSEIRRLSGNLLRKHNLPCYAFNNHASGTGMTFDASMRLQPHMAQSRGHYSVPVQGGRGFNSDRWRSSRGTYGHDAYNHRLSQVSPSHHGHGMGPMSNNLPQLNHRNWADYVHSGLHHNHLYQGSPGYGQCQWHEGDHCAPMHPPHTLEPCDMARYSRPAGTRLSGGFDACQPLDASPSARGGEATTKHFRGQPPPPPPPPPPPAPSQAGEPEDDAMDLEDDHGIPTLTPLQVAKEGFVSGTEKVKNGGSKEELQENGGAPHHSALPPGIGSVSKQPYKGIADAVPGPCTSEHSAPLKHSPLVGQTIHQGCQSTGPGSGTVITVQEMDVESMFAEGIYGCVQYRPLSRNHDTPPTPHLVGMEELHHTNADNGHSQPLEDGEHRDRNRGVKRGLDALSCGSAGSGPPPENHNKMPRIDYPQGTISRQSALHWDEPNADFEAFVSQTLKKKLSKYVQDDHPRRISREDAESLYARIKPEIIDIERKAFDEHQRLNTRRPIEGRKLELNIKEHVKIRVHRMHAKSNLRGHFRRQQAGGTHQPSY